MIDYPVMKKRGGPFYPYDIPYGVRINSGVCRYGQIGSASDSSTKGALNIWFKRTTSGTSDHLWGTVSTTTNYFVTQLTATDLVQVIGVAGGTTQVNLTSTRTIKDPSSWYNVFIRIDTTEGTPADRVKMWVNGRPETLTGTTPGASAALRLFPLNYFWVLGAFSSDGLTNPYDGYIAEVQCFNGTLPEYTDFGNFKYNTWIPKQYTGSQPYGTNGAYWNFSNASDIGADYSGNGNDLDLETAGKVFDQTLDTPTNNFATFDPILLNSVTISEAGIKATTPATAVNVNQPLTIPIPSTGVWRAEFKILDTTIRTCFGISDIQEVTSLTDLIFGTTPGYLLYGFSGDVYKDAIVFISAYTSQVAINDVFTMVMDMDAGEFYYYKNGVSLGKVDDIDTSIQWVFVVNNASGSTSGIIEYHNGAETLDYPDVPGFDLCTKNLPVPEILNTDKGITVLDYEGDSDASGFRTISGGLTFDPTATESLIWIKNLDRAQSHILSDTIRGGNNTIYSDLDLASAVSPINGWLNAFTSYGFQLAKGTNSWNNVNLLNDSYISYNFNMISKYGMDIVTYTGTGVAQAINHNLGGIPELMIVKNTTDAVGRTWVVYHKDIFTSNPANYFLRLDVSDARAAISTTFNDTEPTSTQFTVGTGDATNGNGDTMIAYLFRSIPEFLKIGYYIGNGNANGPRINTGFRPKWLLHKRADNASGWTIRDSVRTPYNPIDKIIQPDVSDTQTSGLYPYDFLSNGFKVGTNVTGMNDSGGRYIYIAFADMPYPYCNAY